MSELVVTRHGNAVRFGVRVQPRASRDEVAGLHGSALKIRVQAAPSDGAANQAVVALIAASLGIPRRTVTIIAGTTSRSKVIEVAGVPPEAISALAAAS